MVALDVPKEGFVTRPAVLLDVVDRIAYQALVDSLTVALIGELQPFVYGWRLWVGNPEKGRYAHQPDQWERFRHRLQRLADEFDFGLATDIVSFFRSVPIGHLEDEVEQAIRRNAVTDRLFDFLHSAQRVQSRGGLPQRCLASSVLAQFYLRPVDDLFAAYADGKAGRSDASVAVCRWMDDVWLFSNDRQILRRIQLKFQQVLSDLGLHLNTSKTQLYEGDDLGRVVNEYEHSAADQGLSVAPIDVTPLEELIDAILRDPESAPRTNVRFVTNRMRTHRLFDHVDRFVDSAPRMPHGADHLARLFRDSEAWRDLGSWFVDLATTIEADLPWTTYQLATMFPSDQAHSQALLDHFANGLVNGTLPIVMMPVGAQRLAAWNSNAAREVIQEAARSGSYENPFALRALAFAGLAVGITRRTVRDLLCDFSETKVSLAYLDARSFRPIRVVKDFG